MSAGDIIRLNRMYNCPNFKESSLAKSSTRQISNDSGSAEVNELPEGENKLNLTDFGASNDDAEDDQILSKEQIDVLFSANSVKRNGIKSAFHHWYLCLL